MIVSDALGQQNVGICFFVGMNIFQRTPGQGAVSFALFSHFVAAALVALLQVHD